MMVEVFEAADRYQERMAAALPGSGLLFDRLLTQDELEEVCDLRDALERGMEADDA